MKEAPRTADGVPVTMGMTVWLIDNHFDDLKFPDFLRYVVSGIIEHSISIRYNGSGSPIYVSSDTVYTSRAKAVGAAIERLIEIRKIVNSYVRQLRKLEKDSGPGDIPEGVEENDDEGRDGPGEQGLRPELRQHGSVR